MRGRSLVVFVLFLTASFGALSPAAASGKRRALLVGVSDYDRGTNPDDAWLPLHTGSDLTNVSYVLTKFYGFKPEDVHVISNEKATQENIEREFRADLIRDTKPGDLTVFYFTGHGFQVPDTNGDETADHLDEALVVWVPREKQKLPAADRQRLMYFIDDKYEALLTELTAKMRESPDGPVRGNVVVIFDSCHSGSATKGSAIPKGRPYDPKIDGPRPAAGKSDPASGWLTESQSMEGVTFLSGSQSDQLSFMMPNSERDGSALTYYMCEFLTTVAGKKTDRTVTYRDLHRWVAVKVSAEHPMQMPQIEGVINTGVFGDGKAVNTPDLAVVQPLAGIHDVQLSEGSLHGVTVGSLYDIYKRNSTTADSTNRIATAEITDTTSITSTARILTTHGVVTRDDYDAAQAVLTKPRFEGRPLKVLVASGIASELAKPLTEALRPLEFITQSGVNASNFDVRFDWDGGYTSQRADGAAVKLGKTIDVPALREGLLAQWRRIRISTLTMPGVSPVTIDITNKDGSPIERSPGGTIVFHPGDGAAIWCTNASTAAMYITLIYLDSAGNITTYPTAAVVNAQQRLNADATRQHLFDLDDIRPPYGTEIMKVIATKKQTDFSGMSYTARDGHEHPKGDSNPLQEILFGIVDGQAKSGHITAASVADWATDQISFEIRPKESK
jgi:hypothetical protein